jgi:superfamily I DNA and RNA helicase
MIEIIQGSTTKPVSSQELAGLFSKCTTYEGQLYIGYPIFATPEGRYPIDAVLLSPDKGVVLFNLVEGRKLSEDYKELQDDVANKLEAKLRNHRSLMKGRSLKVPINIVTFAPAVKNFENEDEDYPVCNSENLIGHFSNIDEESFELYETLLSVIQSISTIRKGRKKRELQRTDSRGAKLKRLEDSIANLDNRQGKAVIETVDDVQRIRGLAGSGKTIVLALKAAYLHAQHPDWKIAVTFNTRSLKGQFKQLINTFVIEQTNEEPDWDNLKIIHAWGAPGGGERDGIYYIFCKDHELEYLDYGSAKHKFGRGNEFAGACQEALNSLIGETKVMYDAILVDEAQDFPPSFLRLCYGLLGEKKRLVYAYDELQNLNSQSLLSPEKIFGKNENGVSRVSLIRPSQDVILEKCYRNSRPVLTTAHALGFGIYRDKDETAGTGLIQMFEQHKLWEDVGYSVESGQLADGEDVTLYRSETSSPKFLEDHSPMDDLVQFHCFGNENEQAVWLGNAIEVNLGEDELRHDDIVVINPNPLKTKKAVGPIRKRLFEKGINSHLAGVDTSPDVFFKPNDDSIVFTGIYRAKGNEAGMVYVLNSQDCNTSFGNLSSLRNQLFTAITRSKAWVRVLGVGTGMKKLQAEFEKVKNNDFKLEFRYPTVKERKYLNIVNRDMAEDERKRVKRGKSGLGELLDDLESGRIFIEDLGEDQIKRFRAVLNKEVG